MYEKYLTSLCTVFRVHCLTYSYVIFRFTPRKEFQVGVQKTLILSVKRSVCFSKSPSSNWVNLKRVFYDIRLYELIVFFLNDDNPPGREVVYKLLSFPRNIFLYYKLNIGVKKKNQRLQMPFMNYSIGLCSVFGWVYFVYNITN